MLRIFKTRHFNRWMAKTGLRDAALRSAVAEMGQGLIDADLGGGVVKKRIALPGRGKRGGTRTLIATNRSDRWFFLFGFRKSDADNLGAASLRELQAVARDLLARNSNELDHLLKLGVLEEVSHEN